jgi:ribosomal protein S18 acetylase RimI-like enzyme
VRIRLRPLGPDEYDAFLDAARDEYARDLVANGGRSTEGARAKAEDDVRELLPDGLETAGQHLEVIVDGETGESVGRLWYGERDGPGGRHIYLYEIAVHDEHRGKGVGRAAMLELEDEARALGHDEVRLNVFGRNAVARRMYRSLGFDEVAVEMTKHL